MRARQPLCSVVCFLLAGLPASPAAAQTVKPYPLPAVSTWAPSGCTDVPYADATTPPGVVWANLHGNGINSDAVTHALAPVFHEAWTVEPATYNVTGPVFDSAGNLYFAPLQPYENVVLISLDPGTGARRFAIPGTGAPPGGSAPLILRDPEMPAREIVYLALRDRVLAVRTDGSIVWDVPSGLAILPDELGNGVLGTSYLPSLDAIVGLAKDGQIYAVARQTGAPLLNAPFSLPGEPTPPGAPLALPPATIAAAEDALQVMVDVPDGALQALISTLRGNGVEVGNMFALDPRTGRLWVAATAPDAEDGAIDGVSELGALYRLELVPSGAGHDIVEVCHRSFAGGTASTPTLSADGSRIYLGDNFGKLLAIKDDCSDAWELDLGAQIFGSVSVPGENHEIFASSAQFVAKVVDQGPSGQLVWTAALDPFENLSPGQQNFNLNLVTTAANGLAFQAGAGILTSTALPAVVGVGLLDRETGAVRSFAAGGEETVAVMSAGPDGALYIGNSPLRRLFAHVLGLSPAPLRGGITKFMPDRLDLLLRDASCAGEGRARNARDLVDVCESSARWDSRVLRDLIDQARDAAARALADGDLSASRALRYERRLARRDEQHARAESDLSPRLLQRVLRHSEGSLGRICRTMSRGGD